MTMTAGAAWSGLGRILIISGLLLVVVGTAFYFLGRHVGHWPRLPGDLTLRVGTVTIYLPLTSCVAASVLLSLLMTFGLYVAGLVRR